MNLEVRDVNLSVTTAELKPGDKVVWCNREGRPFHGNIGWTSKEDLCIIESVDGFSLCYRYLDDPSRTHELSSANFSMYRALVVLSREV